MTTEKLRLHKLLSLKDFVQNPVDVDFGDVSNYIPWRNECKVKMSHIFYKKLVSHVHNSLQIKILGWKNDDTYENIYYPIGKFTCACCTKAYYMNPVQKQYAYAFDIVFDGILCENCHRVTIKMGPASGLENTRVMVTVSDEIVATKKQKP